MLLFEKENLKQEDNSTSSNSENDFKELDNEIDKVIRGKASLEENLSTKARGSTSTTKKEKKLLIKKIIKLFLDKKIKIYIK